MTKVKRHNLTRTKRRSVLFLVSDSYYIGIRHSFPLKFITCLKSKGLCCLQVFVWRKKCFNELIPISRCKTVTQVLTVIKPTYKYIVRVGIFANIIDGKCFNSRLKTDLFPCQKTPISIWKTFDLNETSVFVIYARFIIDANILFSSNFTWYDWTAFTCK